MNREGFRFTIATCCEADGKGLLACCQGPVAYGWELWRAAGNCDVQQVTVAKTRNRGVQQRKVVCSKGDWHTVTETCVCRIVKKRFECLFFCTIDNKTQG